MLRIQKDILWKGIIEDLFDDFLGFFYPKRLDEIDLSKGFEFLDKELHKIQPDNNARNRHADKLVKVYLKDGSEQWMLIHIEVQGYYDKEFAKRMYIYNYRIYERYQKSISALAIYTDANLNFHPKSYSKVFWTTELNYIFDTYKVLEKEAADFDKFKDNPFSVVMKSAWIALKKQQKVDVLDMKLNLARQLMKSGYTRIKTEKVLNFIGHYIHLEKPEEKRIFENEIELLTKPRQKMGIIEAIKEELKKQAIAEGHAEGHAEGRAEAMEESKRNHQLGIILKGIELNLSKEIIAELLGIKEGDLLPLVEMFISRGELDSKKMEELF